MGACHQRSLSDPPSPRFVGYSNSDRVCARAAPENSSIAFANGAVSPSATILLTKVRRLMLPSFTDTIRARS